MSVFVLATLDTKGREAAFVCEQLQSLGLSTTLVDCSCLGEPAVAADISREAIYEAAGTSLADVQQRADRGHAVTTAAQGAATLVRSLFDAGEVQGVFGLGGSAGTTIGTAAMRALPLGLPKVMVSTLASGQVRPYVGDKDIFMLNSIVDISGINRISRTVLTNAARAMAGMISQPAVPKQTSEDKPLIAASMFGVTTPCVEHAKQVLEAAGYEVLVFHATGTGGQAMEALINDGLIAGVLDVTTTELADELVGGVLSAGPERLTAAARHGVPQVISVGALDMVNFGARETVPQAFSERLFYQHNPTVTLMRTTAEESRQLGEQLGQKAAAALGPVQVFLPEAGVSAIDRAGQPFDDPLAREALFRAVEDSAAGVTVIRRPEHINDAGFAQAMAEALLAMLAAVRSA